MTPKTITYQYFKLLLEYIIATALLSVLTFLGCFFHSQANVQKNAVWFALGLFLLLQAPKMPLTIYGLRVWTELKTGNVSERIVTVQSVKSARLHNFRYRSGGIIEEKAVLTDTNGRTYYYIGGTGAAAAKTLQWETVRISCLEKTGFLLSVELASKSPNEDLIRFFYKYFSPYLSLKERSELRSKVRGRIR